MKKTVLIKRRKPKKQENVSFEKTEFDDFIRKGGKGVFKLLDEDLKGHIREIVEIPAENFKKA